jgi:hypothetical protein
MDMAVSAEPRTSEAAGLRPEHLAAVAAIASRSPHIFVRPGTLHLTTDQEGRASGYFLVGNDGQGLLSGTVVSRPSWLRLNVHRFVGNHLQVYVQVDPSKLAIAGAVRDTVTIDSNGGTINVHITCDVNVQRPIQNQTARPALRGRPLVRILEPEPEAEPDEPAQVVPARPPLRLLHRTHQVIVGAVVAGLLGVLVLVEAVGAGPDTRHTAEAAPITNLPPSLLTTR